MKRAILLGFVFMLVVVFSACSQGETPQGQSAATHGTEYNSEADFEVKIIDDGEGIEIVKYVGKRQDVRIPPTIQNMPVTSIGDRAFRDGAIGDKPFERKYLTSVTIPHGVTSIGEWAFSGNKLTSATIPDSVTFIGGSAFENNKLTSVIIPPGLTVINRRIFMNNQLTDVTIPYGVKSIEHAAFGKNQLISVTIPPGVTYICNGAFRQNHLTSIVIPDGVRSINILAFTNNRLTSITLGANVRLGDGTFPAFSNGFDKHYEKNERRKGTYAYGNRQWGME